MRNDETQKALDAAFRALLPLASNPATPVKDLHYMRELRLSPEEKRDLYHRIARNPNNSEEELSALAAESPRIAIWVIGNPAFPLILLANPSLEGWSRVAIDNIYKACAHYRIYPAWRDLFIGILKRRKVEVAPEPIINPLFIRSFPMFEHMKSQIITTHPLAQFLPVPKGGQS